MALVEYGRIGDGSISASRVTEFYTDTSANFAQRRGGRG